MDRRALRASLALAVSLATALFVALGAGPAAVAATFGANWTPLSTGTSSTISAIAYPNANQIIFATTVGTIYYRNSSGGFTQSSLSTPAGVPFSDLAMAPNGVDGVAVGPGGMIYRTVNSGANWTKVSGVQEASGMPCAVPPGADTTLQDDLYSVHFADNSTVYVTGANDDILRSTDGGAAFSEINRTAGGCQIQDVITDTAWTTPQTGYLLSNYFGQYYMTTNGLATQAAKGGSGANGFTGIDRLAVDPGDPLRAWATNPGSNSASYFAYTTDGGSTWDNPPWPGTQPVSLHDVATAGGTVIAVGAGGDIFTSTDGVNFARQPATGADTTNAWNAVALLDASHALVGGFNGRLLASSSANTVPDTTAPTGSVTGPTSPVVGSPATYAVSATDGGSGIDPSSYSCSAAGMTSTGTAPTFTFTNPGPATINCRFADLAGNQGSATLNVTVIPAATGVGTTTGTTNTPAPPATTSASAGNQQLTLTGPAQNSCTGAGKKLVVKLTARKLSRGTKLTFVRAAFYLDKGIRHTRHRKLHGKTRTVITYSANATARHLPVTESLSLKGLKSGAHKLTVVVTFRHKVRGRNKVVTKTLKQTFSVC